MANRVWSNRQNAIMERQDQMVKRANAGNGKQAMLVEACPGSGKTTTLVELVQNHTPGLNALMLAFNREIVKEMSARMPDKNVRTSHSFGLQVCGKNLGRMDVDNDKERKILERSLDRHNWGFLYYPILELVGFCKKNLMNDWTPAGFDQIANFYGLTFDGETSLAYEKAAYVLQHSQDETATVSFDDMLWLPNQLNMRVPKYDYVGVDETQDASPAAMGLFKGALHSNSIWVGVGDPYQAINGFAGAGINSMADLKAAMQASVMPLDITYRCPLAVVDYVNKAFPHISFQPGPDAIMGEVCTARFANIIFTPGDMILCRTNAPLVRPCYSLIRKGIKAIIKGKDIGKGLQAFIKKFNTNDIHELILRMAEYRDEEAYKLRLARKEGQAVALEDKVETILALSEGCSTVYDISQKAFDIFKDETAAITFSSAHRSKGLEAPKVYILRHDLMPHPMAKADWEKQQEDNLRFVAYTRAMQSLIFVEGL